MRKLLLISILFNMGLVLAVGYGFKAKKAAPVASEASVVTEESEDEVSSVAKSPSKRVVKATATDAAPQKPNFHWRDVESADYKTYIENLRRIRCPEATITDIIVMDVNKFYRNRLAPFRKDTDNTFKFWETENGWNRREPAYEKAWTEAEKEKNKLLKELLGVNYREELAKASGWDMEPKDPFYKNMSKETKDRMAEIREKYDERRSEVYRRTRGWMQDEEDTAELKKIEREQLAEMAKFFSPEELFEYQLRSSQTIQNLKWNELEGFNATEEEFRAIAKAKLELENADPDSHLATAQQNRSKLMREYEEVLKKELGEERFKELQQNGDWEYRNLRKLVEKNGGDKELAQQIYGMKDEVRKATNKIRADKSLTKEERNEKLLAVQDTVNQTLTEALGERGFKSFKRNAWWVREIAQGIERK